MQARAREQARTRREQDKALGTQPGAFFVFETLSARMTWAHAAKPARTGARTGAQTRLGEQVGPCLDV